MTKIKIVMGKSSDQQNGKHRGKRDRLSDVRLDQQVIVSHAENGDKVRGSMEQLPSVSAAKSAQVHAVCGLDV